MRPSATRTTYPNMNTAMARARNEKSDPAAGVFIAAMLTAAARPGSGAGRSIE